MKSFILATIWFLSRLFQDCVFVAPTTSSSTGGGSTFVGAAADNYGALLVVTGASPSTIVFDPHFVHNLVCPIMMSNCSSAVRV